VSKVISTSVIDPGGTCPDDGSTVSHSSGSWWAYGIMLLRMILKGELQLQTASIASPVATTEPRPWRYTTRFGRPGPARATSVASAGRPVK
jgi:hypothetical protein